MKQPKYQIGDKVWIFRADKAQECEITAVLQLKDKSRYSLDKLEKRILGYRRESITTWVGGAYFHTATIKLFDEEELFPTKQDLINSL